jgi:hypothetical protein
MADRSRDVERFQRDLGSAVRSAAAFQRAKDAKIRSGRLKEESRELVDASKQLLRNARLKVARRSN